MNTNFTKETLNKTQKKALVKSYLNGWQVAQKNLTVMERAEAIQSFRVKGF